MMMMTGHQPKEAKGKGEGNFRLLRDAGELFALSHFFSCNFACFQRFKV
jgi:hypothetical protein